MFRITLKNLLARKFRLVSTGIAIFIGVAFMAGGLILSDTIGRAFDRLFATLGEETDVVVRSSEVFDADFVEARPRIDDAIVDEIRALDGVDKVAVSVASFRAQIVSADGKDLSPSGGAPPIGDVWNGEEDLSGAVLRDGDNPTSDDEVVIDAGTAEEGDVAVGDTILVTTKLGLTPFTVAGIVGFDNLDSVGGASFVGLTYAAAQEHFGEPGKVDRVSVSAADGTPKDELLERIAAIAPADVEAVSGETIIEEDQEAIGEGFGFFNVLVQVFAGIALFVGSFIIYNTFSILVAQRTREMALLRAIGASRRQVLFALLAEAVVVGVLASIVGLLLGIGLAASLLALLESFGLDLPASGYVVTTTTVVTTLVVGITVTTVAAMFPSWKGSGVPPLAAMRDVALEGRGNDKLRLGIGGVVTVLGMAMVIAGLDGEIALLGFGVALVFLGVSALGPLVARPLVGLLGQPVARTRGIAGQLARENAIRNPKRTSRTAAALLIGVALVATITIVASSVKASFVEIFKESFASDFVVSAGAFGGGVSTQLGNDLRELPEVDLVAPLRFAPGRFDGEDALISGIDGRAASELFDIGVVEGDLADLDDDDGLAVLRERADDEGWQIGTLVPVAFPGTEPFDAVVSVIYTKEEFAGQYFLGLPAFDTHVTDNYDAQIFIGKADDASMEEARAAIEAIAEPYPGISVEDQDQFVETNLAMIDVVLNVIYALLFLSVLIALLGIGNTLFLSIVERTRELGLLRAVGMSRSQLRRSVRWEAILIALFGTIGGLIVGTFFGWAIVEALKEEGLEVFEVPIDTLVVIALIGSLAGVLAAILPARRAARLDILKAIATD